MQLRRLDIATLKSNPIVENIFFEDAGWPGDYTTQLVPLFTQATHGGYRIWYGAQLLASLPPAIKTIRAFLWSPRANQLQILCTIAAWLRQRRELYPLEIAHLTRRIIEQAPRSRRAPLFLQLTGQKTYENWAGLYQALLELNPFLQNYLIEHKAPLKIWALCAEWSPADQARLAQIFQQYSPTLSQAISLIRLLQKLVLLHKGSLSAILTLTAGELAATFTSAWPWASVTELLTALRRQRYPHLTAHVAQLEQLRKQLPLGSQVQVHWDPTFETRNLQVTFQLRSPSDLQRLSEFATSPNLTTLRRMLELL